jgi:flavodoxin
MKIFIMYESMSGNTLTFVQRVTEIVGNVDITITTPSDDVVYDLDDYDKILIGVPTYKNGRMLPKTKEWIIENREELMQKDVLAFGSGITIYPHFCKAVDSVDVILEGTVNAKIKFEMTYDKYQEMENEGVLWDFLELL